MRLLGCEQINLNLSNKFVKTYIQKQNKKEGSRNKLPSTIRERAKSFRRTKQIRLFILSTNN